MHLIVTHAFARAARLDGDAAYARGDAITDPAEIEAVLASDHAGHVVRVDPPTEAAGE